MQEKAAFKIDSLTEGGYITTAPDYSQYSETLDLATKRLVVQVEAWSKNLEKELKAQAAAEAAAASASGTVHTQGSPQPVKTR